MKELNVAVAGNPNCGKTTLFNLLAGTNYHVANYPGITVDKKYATVKHNECKITFHDLPGTYSLTAYSEEERVARNFLIDEKPDLIVQVVDASNLLRNLYLTTQLLELEIPVIIALNMMDMAEKRNKLINAEKLSENLGLPVIKTIARSNKGKTELLDAISKSSLERNAITIKDFSFGDDIDHFLCEVLELCNPKKEEKNKLKWTALKYLEQDEDILQKEQSNPNHEAITILAKKTEKHIQATLGTYPEGIIADYRYGIVRNFLKDVITEKPDVARVYMSDRVDRILTNRFLGPLILFSVLYGIYHFTFWASEYPVGWLEGLFESLSNFVSNNMDDGLLKSLIVSGMIDGVGGVLGFTPLIFFMFFVIAILEDSGYMARMAYMLDRLFKWFGLQGNSVVPFIVSGGIAGGCAVPGVMACRTIKGKKERLITILTAPFMSCGAKLPVFALLVSAFFPGGKALAMLAITILSWFLALIIAKLYSLTVVPGKRSSFIMELPPYRFPTLKGLLLHAWERTWMYIKKAGTIILAVSVVFWILMTFPRVSEQEANQFKNELKQTSTIELTEEQVENHLAQYAMKNSIAGSIGSVLEPVSKFSGFDWRTNVALIGGFAAKEIVVSTLGTAYSLGEIDVEESDSLGERLKKDPNWNIGVAIALILFTILYAPCFVTVVAIARETRSIKWALFSVVSNTTIAFIVSTIAYQIFK